MARKIKPIDFANFVVPEPSLDETVEQFKDEPPSDIEVEQSIKFTGYLRRGAFNTAVDPPPSDE